MRKLLILTGLILACSLGNLGTNSAQAHGLSKTQVRVLQHNLDVSDHTIQWYEEGKGHWTRHVRFKTCTDVAKRYSPRRAGICYKARLDYHSHLRRYHKIWGIFHPVVYYSDGGYNWDKMVFNCEARNSGWYSNTGNGFYFGPQFTKSTWHSSGGGPVREMGDLNGLPMTSYSISYIKHIAYRTMQLQGPGAWPNCSGYLY